MPMVEIDHSANIWHDRPALAPLKSMDKNDNIIYLGSMLKCHPYDFQLSWIVADRYIVEHLSNVFIQTGVKPNFTMQLIADELFRSGAIYEMMQDMKTFIRKRSALTLSLCEKHLKAKGFWVEKNCNFHFWLNFPDINFKNIFSKRGLITNIYPGYFFDKADTSHILLCPASIQEKDIEKTIMELSFLVNSY
jgi:DNA-binding transcriptional MocR family regulator